MDRRQSSQFLHPDPAVRERSYEWLDDSLGRAAETGARFAVTHVADSKEPLNFDSARDLALEAAERMSEASERHGVEAHIEFLGYHASFHEPSHFVELFESNPRLGLCLDTGHLHRWSQIRGGDERAAARVLAPHVGSMHIWNISSAEEFAVFGHVPVHPSHRVEDGYADIERIVETAVKSNPEASIVFEPTIKEETSEDFVAEGIAWVREFLGR
jgi:sugar phosphate isomerase/epimerase